MKKLCFAACIVILVVISHSAGTVSAQRKSSSVQEQIASTAHRDSTNAETASWNATPLASDALCSNSITVQNTNDSDAGSLRQAIADLCAGGQISFNPSLAGATITLATTLMIGQSLTIDGSALASMINVSGNNSVRIFLVSPGVTATIKSLVIKNGNTTANGGAIYNNGGTLTLTDSQFSGNIAVIEPYVVGNGEGGAIYNQGVLTITNSAFNSNNASRGGAISCSGGTITITDSTYSSNNALSDSGGDGGAIYTTCASTIEKSTFSSNTAAHYGGAILTDNNVEPVEVTNSTFYGNTALSGGGIANYGGLVITNSTFSGNNSSNGGAIRNGLGGTLSLLNSILANSVGGVDCSKSDSAPAIQNINNLIESTGADFESCGTSLLTSDPVLGPLQDNGGPTQTMALSPTSPAIDAGDDANCAATDQRGVTRPLGIGCDIGSYEIAHVTIQVADEQLFLEEMKPDDRQTPMFTGVQAGPVRVNGDIPFFTSERSLYGPYATFNEVMGFPNNQLTTRYWFPWYDNKDMTTWILVGNPSTTLTANVTIKIAGQTVYSQPLGPNGIATPQFPNVQNGPVEVLSNIPIFTSERALYGAASSFNEVIGFPNNQLTNRYWFPWYDNKDMTTWILVGNPSTTLTANVTIKIAGQIVYSQPLGPNGIATPTFGMLQGGPVEVISDNPILTSERSLYGPYGTFNEVMGFPHNQLTTRYWFPWYDNKDMSSWVLVGNPSTNQTANVTIKIAGQTVYSKSLGPGAIDTPMFGTTQDGPVEVLSDIPIFTSERAVYGPASSFNEVMGFPHNQLTTDYWFTWYDGKDMSTWILVGTPD